jgi:hypothetical protein
VRQLAFFRSRHPGIDHHSYEAGEWTKIRDSADHFAARNIRLIWGPGRHGPGNNLFVFCFHRRYGWQLDRSLSFRRARGRSRPSYQGLAPRRKDPEPLGSRDHAQLVSRCTNRRLLLFTALNRGLPGSAVYDLSTVRHLKPLFPSKHPIEYEFP